MPNLTFNQRRAILGVILALASVPWLNTLFDWKLFASHDKQAGGVSLLLLIVLRFVPSMEEMMARRRTRPRSQFVSYIVNLSIILIAFLAGFATVIKEWVGAGRWDGLIVTAALILAGALMLTRYGRRKMCEYAHEGSFGQTDETR